MSFRNVWNGFRIGIFLLCTFGVAVHAQSFFGTIVGTVGSTTLGVVTNQANNPRLVQLALRLRF